MSARSGGHPGSLRLLAAFVWSCWPCALFYILVLRRSEFGGRGWILAILLLPGLGVLAHQTICRLAVLTRNDWARVLLSTGLFGMVLGIMHLPTLRAGQEIPGMVGRLAAPAFRLALAAFVLWWGTVLYVVAAILVRSRILWKESRVPSWAGWSLIIGVLVFLILLLWDVPSTHVELALVLCLFGVVMTPAHLIAAGFRQHETIGSAAKRAVQMLDAHPMPFVIAASLLLTLAVFGSSVHTNWSIIDDHEIMLFTGPGRAASLGHFLQDLSRTEIGQFGRFERFRPTYWFLRLLESYVWGPHPYRWHAFRLVILTIGLATFWKMLMRPLGWLAAGLLCAYSLTFPYWWQVIGLLGPGETYAVAGLPIFIAGFAHLIEPNERPQRRALAAAAVLMGTILCAGSKESFVLMAIPSAYLAYRAYRRHDALVFACSLASVLFAGYVTAGVALAIADAGLDIYNRSVSPWARASMIVEAFGDRNEFARFFVLAGLTLVSTTFAAIRGPVRRPSGKQSAAPLWLLVLCLIYLSQMFFYGGTWPDGSRYDFPGLLYVPAAVLIVFMLATDLVPASEQIAGRQAARTALAFSLALMCLGKGYGHIVERLEANVAETQLFVSSLDRATSTLQARGDHALTVQTESVLDYEKVFSIVRFLRAYGVENKIFLTVSDEIRSTAAGYRDPEIVRDLFEVSATGNAGPATMNNTRQLASNPFPGYSPLSELAAFGSKCYAFILSGPGISECRPLR